jgi:phosphoglycolate phosphatase
MVVSPTSTRPPAEGYRLVIFDWDGTLLDSVGSIVECTQVTLAELQVATVPEATIRGVLGLGLRETVETLCPGCDEELFLRVVETYRKHWFSGYNMKPVLFTGVVEALDTLRQQGYLLAVATAKGRIGLDDDLGATGLTGHFATTRTITEAPSKPHPGMVLDILDELDVPPAAALVVGDTTHDLRMAANAGVTSVAVCSGSHPRDELLAMEPAGCLAGADELPGWLAGVPA